MKIRYYKIIKIIKLMKIKLLVIINIYKYIIII